MKKSLLGLLLAVALVVPAFAQKGDMSINGKVGFGLSNYGTAEMENDLGYYTKYNIPVSLTAEYFYEFIDNLSAGIGATYTFDSNSKSKEHGEAMEEAGGTNIYIALKPEFKSDSKIFTSLYVIGQIGVSMNRSGKLKNYLNTSDPKAGIYLGIGAGTVIANQVIVELLYSSANGKVDHEFEGDSYNIRYSALTLNLGYKFAL